MSEVTTDTPTTNPSSKPGLGSYVLPVAMAAVLLVAWALLARFVGWHVLLDGLSTTWALGKKVLFVVAAVWFAIVVGRFLGTRQYKKPQQTFGDWFFLIVFPADMVRRVFFKMRKRTPGTSSQTQPRNPDGSIRKTFMQRRGLLIGLLAVLVALVLLAWSLWMIVLAVLLVLRLAFDVWVVGMFVSFVLSLDFWRPTWRKLLSVPLWFTKLFGHDVAAKDRLVPTDPSGTPTTV